MKKIFTIVFSVLLAVSVFADNDDADKKYSWKDFTDKKFLSEKPSEFTGKKIVGSCFYQQNKTKKRIKIFPTGTESVMFVECNLDNVEIPPNSTVIGGCARIICDAVDGGYIIDNKQNIVDKFDNMSDADSKMVYKPNFDINEYRLEKQIEPVEELLMEAIK